MRTIGNMMIAENGKEAFDLATAKAVHSYEVEQSISGYYRLLCDGEYLHDDSACADVNEEESAYYFFSELVVSNERETMEMSKKMEAIAARMSAIDGEAKCEVIKAVELEGAVMYIVKAGEYCTTCAIVHDDGTLFHLRDWQGGYPETAEEIEDYDWLTEDGRRAVVFGGLPRVL